MRKEYIHQDSKNSYKIQEIIKLIYAVRSQGRRYSHEIVEGKRRSFCSNDLDYLFVLFLDIISEPIRQGCLAIKIHQAEHS